MAPKKAKLNVEEQAAKLNLRALALKNKGMKARIDTMLKNRPELHSTVIQHLVGMGCVDPGHGSGEQAGITADACLPLSEAALCALASSGHQKGLGTEKLPECSPAKASASTSRSSAASATSGLELEFSAEELELTRGTRNSKLEEWVPRCHQTYEAMTPVYFQYILSKLEPSSLSLAAQRGLCSSKSKHVPKASLIELFQFITGIAPDADFKPDMHYLPFLISILQEASAARGRPAQGLILPPCWGQDGIYKVTMEDDALTLHHKTLKEKAVLPADFASMVKVEDITIEKNFSEPQATLVSGYLRYTCNLSFPHAQYKLALQPPPLRQWLSEREELKAGRKKKPDDEKALEKKRTADAGEGEGQKAACKMANLGPAQTAAVDETLEVPPEPEQEG
jgi:hypothetical protein